MLQNTAIVKGVGGIAAVGTIGGGGYYLHHSGIIGNIFGGNLDTSIYLVTQISDDSSKAAAALYKDNIKNYYCQFAAETDKQYDCDILDEITTAKDKKWINFGAINSETKINNALTKDKLVKDSYFSLKTEADLETKINSAKTTVEITIIPKVKVANEDTKVFGKFKVITSKKGNKPIGQFQQFLGKATKVDEANNAGTEKKCQFADDDKTQPSDLKACSLQIFADTQSTPANYNDLAYKGSEADFSSVPVPGNYYVVKFSTESDKFSEEKFSNKKLIYFEHATSDTNTSKKKVVFSFNPVVVHTGTDNSQKILVIH